MTEFLQFIQNNKLSRFFFFLLVLLLPVQIGKHFWPSFSLIDGLRIDYLSPTLYLTDIVALLFIVTTIKKFSVSIFFYIFLVVVSVGIFLSKQPFSGWYGLVKILEYFFLWMSLRIFLSKEKHFFNILFFPLTISIWYESMLSFFQFFLQRSIGGIFYFLGERTFTASTPGIANASIHGTLIMRPYATFPHPNVFAGFLLISLTILLQQFFLEKNMYKKIYLLATMSIGTLAIFISLGRVAIVLWIIVGLYLLIKNVPFKENKSFFYSLLFTTLSSVVILLYVSHGLTRLENISLTDESVTQRIFLLETSWRIFLFSPLFGVGFANFLINLSQVGFGNFQTYIIQPVHNIFVLLLTETGIIGFFFIVWFCFATIKNLFFYYKKEKNEMQKRIYELLFVLFLEWLSIGQFDHYLITLQQGQLLTVLIFALCWSFPKKSTTISS